MRTDGVKLVDWFLTIVLSVHLLAMNLASAGPLVGMWIWGKDKRQQIAHQQIGRSLTWLSIGALLLGILLGGLLWWCARSSSLGEAIARLPARALVFAASELVFSLVCLLACAWCWSAERNLRWKHTILALLSSTNLLYHFPPLMSVLGRIASDPSWARVDVLDRAALLPLMGRAEVLALTVHFALASIALAAVVTLWIVSNRKTDEGDEPALPLARGAAWIALLATVCQVPVGVWLMVSLPTREMSAIMGSNVLASVGFCGALLLTFVLLQRLLGIAIGQPTPRSCRAVGWVFVVLVLLMTFTLKGTREAVSTGAQAGTDTKSALERASENASPQGCWV